MRIRTRAVAALVLTAALLFGTVSSAFAAVQIYETGTLAKYLGVAGARLTYSAATNRTKIPGYRTYKRDTNYPGQIVYVYYYGTPYKVGTLTKYPCEMYTKPVSPYTFTFVLNKPGYQTLKRPAGWSRGLQVGDSQYNLVRTYGIYSSSKPAGLRIYPSSIYTTFRLLKPGGRTAVDFRVKNSTKYITTITLWTR